MIYELIDTFRKKLKDGFVLGVFSKTCDPAFIETMGYGGLDFVIIDLEHGPNSVQTVQNLLRAAELSGIFPIVRVKEYNYSVIGEVLDAGAGGIQVPKITGAEDARRVFELSKFAPSGNRGVCRFVRAAGYSSVDRYRYFREANRTIVVLQLEGEEAIGNLQEIVQVQGPDILFIGPYDLSQSMGVSGQIDHPLVERKMKEIIGSCRERNIAVGTFVDTMENAHKWRRAGISYLAYSVDVGLFLDTCAELVRSIRG
jgi:4-hydroxy-2-oxoheptanedioate aldolase